MLFQVRWSGFNLSNIVRVLVRGSDPEQAVGHIGMKVRPSAETAIGNPLRGANLHIGRNVRFAVPRRSLPDANRNVIRASRRERPSGSSRAKLGRTDDTICTVCPQRAPSSLQRGRGSFAGREVRGSGELGLRFEAGDSLAQCREGALQRLLLRSPFFLMNPQSSQIAHQQATVFGSDYPAFFQCLDGRVDGCS